MPGLVISVEDGNLGRVDVLGTVRVIDLSLLSGRVLPGEHVLIHSGFALQRLSSDQAREGETLFAPGRVTGAALG